MAGERDPQAMYHTLYYEFDYTTAAGQQDTARVWFENDVPTRMTQEEYRTVIEAAFAKPDLRLVKATTLTVAEHDRLMAEYWPEARGQGEGA